MTAAEADILTLDRKLQGVRFQYAFIGGAVLSLLVDDPEADSIRVTKDVDVVMNIRTRAEFHDADEILLQMGFRHDTREGAPICRWICDGVTVDVLPMRGDVLGWDSKWFEEALGATVPIVRDSRSLNVISAPYFVALKLEAFEGRGHRDFILSSDFEDVICLFNGRASIVEEIASCEALRGALALKFAEYMNSPDLEDAVEGFVQTENDPERRKKTIMSAFAAVAALKYAPGEDAE